MMAAKASPEWDHLKTTVDGAIGTLTLSRPPVNALNRALVKELRKALDWFASHDEVQVVILTSDQKHFSAGADLKERSSMALEKVPSMVGAIGAACSALANLPQPTIAAIHGAAMGGGAELALACDLRVMAEDASFALSEVSLGIIPGAGGTQRLPRLIGSGAAMELILTGRAISGLDCGDLRLSNRVVSVGEVQETAVALAAEVARNAPLALRAAKKAINAGLETTLDEGLSIETEAYMSLLETEDRVEGLNAHKNKRKPVWRGK